MHDVSDGHAPASGELRWYLVASFAVLAVFLLWATLSTRSDDAHITFTYSRNLADGLGFVFNPGERTLSTTTPLTALLMAIPSAAGLDLQVVGIVVSIGAAAAIAVLLAVNLRRYVAPWAIVLGAAVVFLHPFTLTTVANEMLAYSALALGAFHAVARGRFGLAGTLAGLCAMTRPDGGLVVVLVLALAAATVVRAPDGDRTRWFPLLRAGGWAGLILLPWALFATWYYGSPVPVTLRAKQAQRESGHGSSFVELLGQRFELYVDGLRWVLAGALLAIGLVVGVTALVRHVRRASSSVSPPSTLHSPPWPLSTFSPEAATIVLALAWNLSFCIAYVVLDVSAYGWYAMPLVIALAILTSLGSGWLLAALGSFGRWARRSAAVALAAVVVLPLVLTSLDYARRDESRTVLYQPTAEWIDEAVPLDASVGTLEVGLIGYFSNRRIVDFAGLLQPDAATEAELDEGFDAIAFEAWRRYEPEFVAMLSPGIPTILDDPAFGGRCRLAHSVTDPRVVEVMDIFDCR